MALFLPLPESPQFDPIIAALNTQFEIMAQMDRPSKRRTQTARSYASALRALVDYMHSRGEDLPTRDLLDHWRDDMLEGHLTTDKGKALAINSVNVRLAAARALLRGAAPQLAKQEHRILLRQWAEVADAKAVFRQDVFSEEVGLSLTISELDAYIAQIKTNTIKGLRDRALIMILAGAGLHISEAVRLTLADVFLTGHPSGVHGIRVQHGKYRPSRIVVLGPLTHPIFQAVSAYLTALDVFVPQPSPSNEGDSLADRESNWALEPLDTRLDYALIPVFRSLKRGPNRKAISTDRRLSPRSVERIVAAYPARHHKKQIQLAPHDLRRTFAKLCQDSGMSWEAVRLQMGHRAEGVPNGTDIDWSQRIPAWTFKWVEGKS